MWKVESHLPLSVCRGQWRLLEASEQQRIRALTGTGVTGVEQALDVDDISIACPRVTGYGLKLSHARATIITCNYSGIIQYAGILLLFSTLFPHNYRKPNSDQSDATTCNL